VHGLLFEQGIFGKKNFYNQGNFQINFYSGKVTIKIESRGEWILLYICVLFVKAPQLLANTQRICGRLVFFVHSNIGIISKVKIRCFNVKDLAKVDLEVLNEVPNREAYKAKLSAYYDASLDNLDKQLKQQCSVSCGSVEPGGTSVQPVNAITL
jgi:hypothetical protein